MSYYLKEHGREVRRTGLEPGVHYLRLGGRKGYNPSPEFDSAAYAAENSDVRGTKINPLIHYLKHGRAEGRAIYKVRPLAPAPEAPTPDQWAQLSTDLASDIAGAEPSLDVVVPVYRGFEETANCLFRLIQTKNRCETLFDIVVINDATPQRKISNLLADLERKNLITLISNPRNIGFVGSVNIGMRLHQDRDVILLNSDTEVFGDWVDRLRRAAYSSSDIGTVTPLSNNATICSYPNFPADYRGNFEVSFEQLDQLARSANGGKTAEIPTAVGFCMYIRRECLREVGYFDEAAFGLGYGEENDFSLRLVKYGWRNVLAGDVFVRHIGRVSFMDSTDWRVKQGLQVIKNRYPHFLATIMAFVKSDPLKELRRNLDVARARKTDRAVLFVVPNLEGGTKRHVDDMLRLLRAEGVSCLFLQPASRGVPFAVIKVNGISNLSNGLEFNMRHEMQEASALLRALAVRHIHVHHTLGFFPEITDWVERIAEMCGLSYDVTLHDYFLACPRINLIDHTGLFCNNTNVEVCEACIQSNGSPAGDVSVWRWRKTHEAFLRAARKVFVPDESARQHLLGFFPSVPIEVREHPEENSDVVVDQVSRATDEPLRVAIIGAIGPHKGSLILEKCAEDAAERNLPIEFHVIGYSDRKTLAEFPTVKMTGRYNDQDLMNLLARRRCHIAFFPSPWPETYSYTLSEAWAAGLYPVAFDLGAMAQRIRQKKWGQVIPLEMASFPRVINDTLLSLAPAPRPPGFQITSRSYKTIWHDYYGFDAAHADQKLDARAS